jgi:adenylate kinase
MLLKSTYADSEPTEKNRIGDVIKNKVIFFTGYPGSGKGTQGKRLAAQLNIRHLSTGELFRAEAEKKTEIGLQMDSYMQKGQIIPKALTFAYLKQELSKPEYRNGFILDGYPKNLESYEFILSTLKELQFEPLAAMHFDVSRQEVVNRLTGRRHCNQCEHDFHVVFLPPKQENLCDYCTTPLVHRQDDSESAITQRLDVFELNTYPVIQKFSDCGLLVRLKADQKPNAVFQDITSTIGEIGRRQIQEGGSYYLRIPKAQENSSVFHNHVDAQSHELLRSIIHRVEEVNLRFQNKIFPVSHLQLGPQVEDPDFASVYRDLPNFHSIDNATEEAFATGKMGKDGFDYDQVRKTLEIAFQYPDQRVMTELEEDIFQMDFNARGIKNIVLDSGNTPYAVDWDQLPGWKEKQIPQIPRFELHHGFDVVKNEGESHPPIMPSDLSQITSQQGFQTGGWFIFRKTGVWSYRSNEFSNKDYISSLDTLNAQAQRLRNIVAGILSNRKFTSSCSMEKVHAIWRIQ